MAEQKQVVPTPVSEKEVELLKMAFKDNEYLLKLIRGLFFGFDLTESEKNIIKSTFSNAELRKALRKKTFPLFDNNEMPVGQIADFWMGTEQNILGAHRDLINQVINSKHLVYMMLTKAFALLENPDGEKVNLTYVPNLELDELQVGLLARNLYMKTIEQGLLFVKLIADQKSESISQKKKRSDKDSGE